MTTYPQEYVLANTFSGVHADSVNKIRVSPDGRYFASASEEGTVAVYDLTSGLLFGKAKFIRKYASPGPKSSAMALCWGRDSTELYVGFEDGTVCSYRRPTRSGVSRSTRFLELSAYTLIRSFSRWLRVGLVGWTLRKLRTWGLQFFA
jgi:WD40 repeat protein